MGVRRGEAPRSKLDGRRGRDVGRSIIFAMPARCAGRFVIAGLMAGLAATAGLRAGQPPQTEPFRAAVDLVRLDFLALSQDGAGPWPT
jgi:hypothetical protein